MRPEQKGVNVHCDEVHACNCFTTKLSVNGISEIVVWRNRFFNQAYIITCKVRSVIVDKILMIVSSPTVNALAFCILLLKGDQFTIQKKSNNIN